MDEHASLPRHRRWHIPLALLLVATGLFVLAHTVVATRVSVRTLGAALVLAGLLLLGAALLAIGRHTFWFAGTAGALATSLGIAVLRHPVASATGLTLLLAVVFVAGGTMRLLATGEDRRSRVLLVVTGLLAVSFGAFVLSDPNGSSLTLLGRMLGVQITLDGLTLLAVGRLRAGLRDPRNRRVHRSTADRDPAPTAEAASVPHAAH